MTKWWLLDENWRLADEHSILMQWYAIKAQDPFEFPDKEDGELNHGIDSDTQRCVMFFTFPSPSLDVHFLIFGREFLFQSHLPFPIFKEKYHPLHDRIVSPLRMFFFCKIKKLFCSVENISFLSSLVKKSLNCFTSYPESTKHPL